MKTVYEIDPAHSSAQFTIRHLMISKRRKSLVPWLFILGSTLSVLLLNTLLVTEKEEPVKDLNAVTQIDPESFL